MSAVKILAFGILATGTVAHSTLAGSMSRGRGGHRAEADRDPAETSFRIAPTGRHVSFQEFGAQNLATTSNNPANGAGQQAINGPGQGGGLVLGTSGAMVGTAYPNQVNNPGATPALPTGYLAPISLPASPPDAFINFGTAPFTEAGTLTTGNPVPFFESAAFTHLFPNGSPSSSDVARFEAQVMATIQHTYDAAHLPIRLTADPTAGAVHSMSVVSGASYSANPDVIGITDVGNNGFSFIDKFGSARSVDQLAVAIGHNLSHELMHAFGIADHPEQGGPYVDAATASLATLSDANTGFSDVAARLLSTLNFQDVGDAINSKRVDGGQILIPDATTVPEPSTVALWALVGGVALAIRRGRRAC